MKKLSKLLALAAGLTTLFFTACSDISDDSSGTMTNGVIDKTSSAKEYNVSFVASDGSALELESLGINSDTISSRTIVADAIDISSGVKFYIWGKDEINPTTNTVSPKEVKFVADTGSKTSGTVVLDYSASKYFFVLAAVPSDKEPNTLTIDNIKGAAVYIGYANVDLRNGDAIKFYISADGLTGGGQFALTIKTDTSWSPEHLAKVKDTSKYTITAGLYNRETDVVLSNPSAETVTNTEFVGSGHVWNATELTVGTYNFVVKFVAGEKTYEYSDVIIILPNQKITKTIEIPDIIEYAPISPTAFKIAYIQPTVNTTDSYNALLQWTDNSKNERYFKIEYVDVSAQGASYVNDAMQTAFKEWRAVEGNPAASDYTAKKTAADNAWTTAITSISAKVKTLDYGFYGNPEQNWVAGTLQKNSKNILMSLALGKRYIFRISAVNDAGISDNYSYATYSDDLTWIILDTDYTPGTYSAKAFATKKANISTPATYDTFTYNASSPNIPSGATKFYAENDTEHETQIAAASLEDGTTYIYEKTAAVAAGYTDATSLTANLYRLTYHLNGGTYNKDSGAGVTADIVEYKCQGDIDLYCPNNPIATGAEAVYPQLKNTSGKRWTAWKQGSTVGTNYGVATTVDENGIKFTYYDPGDYTGYANFDLFASFNLSNASVIAYNDSDYDIKDIITDTYTPHTVVTADKTGSDEFYTRSGDSEPYTYTKVTDNSTLVVDNTVYTKVVGGTAAVKITTTGVTATGNHYYTVPSNIAKVTFKYQGTVEYSSLKAVVKRSGTVVGAGDFTSSKTYDLETKSLALGTYIVTVYGEYAGHTYSYIITVVVQDPD